MKMLIADDEITIRRGLRGLVESFQLPIEVAAVVADGKEALLQIRQVRPELMLVDINMPHCDGLEFAGEALRLLPQSKLIIISGYDKFEYACRALKMGVFDYLLKPINRITLQHTVEGAISSYQQRAQELHQLRDFPKCDLPQQAENYGARAIAYIQKQHSNPHINLTELAEQMHVSSAYLSRSIKQRTGKNFSEYLNELRMERAIAILSTPGNIMIYSVAEQVGYTSQHYFCRIFKEYTGKTPSQWRQALRTKI